MSYEVNLVANKEETIEEFKKIYRDAEISIYVGMYHIVVTLHFDIWDRCHITYLDLMQVAKIFGTRKFEIMLDKEPVRCGSSVTPETEYEKDLSFSVQIADLNTEDT